MKEIRIREIRRSEIGKLEDMLYEAVYQPDRQNSIPRTVLQAPEIHAYIKDFGNSPDDYCLVAEAGEKIIGAVWVRILSGEIKGYGNVDDATPEFAISLFEEYRNKGLGTELMNKMIARLQKRGYKQASLSVDKANYAVKMYKKLGFEIVRENEHDYIMVLKLQ